MAEEEKNFNPTFENGGFWEYYKDLEGNEDTYSFRLANLLLGIGAHVDSAFKEMARSTMFSDREPFKEILRRTEDRQGIIVSAIRAFDKEYGIKSKRVTFKCLPNMLEVTPFEEDCPDWWDFYNDVKHDITTNLSKANLKNVRDALAGAFLLNVIFEPATYRLAEQGFVRFKISSADHCEKKLTFYRGNCRNFTGLAVPDYAFDCLIETPLFIYEYRYERSEETG